jgi:hypothetical protein
MVSQTGQALQRVHRQSSLARDSSRSKRRWRAWSSPKSTGVAVEVGAVTQAKRIIPFTVTRHEPHMPVPSTMIALRETRVLAPKGRIVSAHAFIMGKGPMATTRSGLSIHASSDSKLEDCRVLSASHR